MMQQAIVGEVQRRHTAWHGKLTVIEVHEAGKHAFIGSLAVDVWLSCEPDDTIAPYSLPMVAQEWALRVLPRQRQLLEVFFHI